MEQPRLCAVWVHRTVSGAPGWSLVNWPLSGIRRRRTAKIHRTVRWCTGLSGEPTVGRANGLNGAPDCPVCTRQCPVRQRLQIFNGRLHKLEKQSAPDTEQCLSGGTPDCPVRHPTEGKNCLPGLLSTAPSCLGAIKGTPWRMEEHTKHTLNILRLPHPIFAHSIDILSDLSSVLVVNLLCFN